MSLDNLNNLTSLWAIIPVKEWQHFFLKFSLRTAMVLYPIVSLSSGLVISTTTVHQFCLNDKERE